MSYEFIFQGPHLQVLANVPSKYSAPFRLRDATAWLLYAAVYPFALPSVLWRCWLGVRKSIRPVKTEWWGAGRLSVWSKLQMICIWSSWCQCHPIISSFIKIQTGLTFLVPAYPSCRGKEAIKRVSLRAYPCVDKTETVCRSLMRPRCWSWWRCYCPSLMKTDRNVSCRRRRRRRLSWNISSVHCSLACLPGVNNTSPTTLPTMSLVSSSKQSLFDVRTMMMIILTNWHTTTVLWPLYRTACINYEINN